MRFIPLLLLCFVLPASAAEAPLARAGLIDLSMWNFDRDGPVALDGEYEFYWQQHLSSADFFTLPAQAAYTIDVPSSWNGKIVQDQSIGGAGYATYRLNILITPDGPMAFKVPDLGTAYRLIVDGRELFRAGEPGTSETTTEPAYRPAVVQFTPRSGRVELILQVSNFHHRLGGAWLHIDFGKPGQLNNLRENQLARDLILFGAILIIGLYNFALYALRPENRSSLFLGIFCVLLATRQLMVGDRFMTRLLPDLPFDWYLRIEYLGWYIAAMMFVAFLQSIFPREVNRLFARGMYLVFGAGSLVVLLTSTRIFTYTAPGFQLLTLLALLYGFWCLVSASIRQRDGARILLFAYTILFISILSDILVNAGLINNVLLLDVGLFVFILCQSILISYRFTQSFKTIEAQRTQLEAANLKLRTQEKLRRDAEVQSEVLHQRIAQSEKMEAIGLLASGVAHDLNNILSTTVTYPELVLLDLPPDSPLTRPLQLTRQAGLRAAAVIQDLLTLARRGVIQREVLNLNQVIEDYLNSVEHDLLLSNHPGIHLVTDLDPELDNIEGSPVHLQKLIMNLVSNALEAQDHKGTVRISTHNEKSTAQELFYMPLKAGHYVILSVEDEGSGIDHDDLDKVFEPFYTTKVMGQSGTGLGMSVIWGVVYDHGGAIDVMTEKDAGTRFDIYLPRTSKPAPPRPAYQPIINLLGTGEKILVVDDMEDQRELTCAVLSRLGYTPDSCASGPEAVAKLAEASFDLVLLDMVMDDEWDGLTTFREIRKLVADQKTLLVSGFAETEQVTQAQAEGAGPFLRKPFTLEAIGSTIRQLLRS
ncbi:MAG: 7TM diverse intracellular signaling domain-containing protein [Pseudomonadota bacterium]